MAASRTSTVRDLRRSNRSQALWETYLHGPLTRPELGEAMGVSAATVSNVVGDLLELGVLAEAGQEDSDGGRPRALLQINSGYGHVVGVDIGETAVLTEAFDLGMNVLASDVAELHAPGMDVDETVAQVTAGVNAVLKRAGIPRDSLLGVGVGVPGLVEHGPDAVVHGQTIGWSGVPLGRLLTESTQLPVLVDNGAKTQGQAEMWFGAGRGVGHAVILLLGAGSGTSIVTGGVLYRGATSSAGEWGHTTMAIDGRLCRCGNRGCLEAYVGAGAISARYDELKRQPVEEDLHQLESKLAEILAAADTDRSARRVLDEAATYLGAGIADLINLFNPEKIIIGGWMGKLLGPTLLPGIKDTAAERALTLPFSRTSIEQAQLGTDAVALGAATLPVEQLLASGAVPSPRLDGARERSRRAVV
jgi:predicted NBD/HSP70 family sugar kinase